MSLAFVRQVRRVLLDVMQLSGELADLWEEYSDVVAEHARRTEEALEQFREAPRVELALMEEERVTAYQHWNALSADDDDDGGLGYALSVQNFRRCRIPKERLYEVTVFAGPLYKQHCNTEECRFLVREQQFSDSVPASMSMRWRNLDRGDDSLIEWEYVSQNLPPAVLATCRAQSGQRFFLHYQARVREETLRWEAEWDARRPWMRRALFAFFGGKMPDVRERFLENFREYWLDEQH